MKRISEIEYEIGTKCDDPVDARRRMQAAVKDFADVFDPKQFNEGFEPMSWIYHGSLIKEIIIFLHFGAENEEPVHLLICLKRYQNEDTDRTLTAFPAWLIRWNKYTLLTILRLLWMNLVDGEKVSSICDRFNISEKVFYRWKRVYKAQVMEMLPMAMQPEKNSNGSSDNSVLQAVTVALLGEDSAEGLEFLSIAHKGLANVVAAFKAVVGLPLMQARNHWKKKQEDIRSRATHRTFHGIFPGSIFKGFYAHLAYRR